MRAAASGREHLRKSRTIRRAEAISGVARLGSRLNWRSIPIAQVYAFLSPVWRIKGASLCYGLVYIRGCQEHFSLPLTPPLTPNVRRAFFPVQTMDSLTIMTIALDD
jgi:hypothetical protein